MILDFVKSLLSGFLLLLVVMTFAALVAYRLDYMGKEKQATTITLDQELLDRIDQYRVEKGLESREKAISHALDRALTENEEPASEKSPSNNELNSH
jgi:hypothetical protein